MSKRNKAFKPTLELPVPLNNYSGKVFRCFTQGDTLPFKFTLKPDSDADPVAADWKVYVVMADGPMDVPGCTNNQRVIEVEIPLTDLAGGVFEGNVTNHKTQNLPVGLIYAMAKFVTSPVGTTPGETFIIDMCMLEMYPNVALADL